MHANAAYRNAYSRYGMLIVFANDIGAATQSLLTYGEWAENEITFLQQFVTSGSTVLDVGAYIGTHTLAFARLVGPAGRVIAIEAQPATFEVLKENVERNLPEESRSIVELENAVASCELGQVSIPTIDVKAESSFGSASLVGALTDAPRTPASDDQDITHSHARVKAITVDSLDLQNCAVIKVDVEGVEDMVLNGAIQTLERCSPVIYCECNSLAAGLKSMAVLETARYRVFAHVVSAFNADNYFGVRENIFANAREAALVGVPVAQVERIKNLRVRPFELLLDISDADDLALALLHKPQYPAEVLRHGHAAKTGGVEFLDQYDASRLELDHLRSENPVLRDFVAEERHALERIQSAHEQTLALLKERDGAIEQLEARLTERDATITRQQASIDQEDRDIAALRFVLAQRDGDIARLQPLVEQRKREAAELQISLTQRHIDISNARDAISRKDLEICQLQDLLKQRGVNVTKPVPQGNRKR